MMLQKDFSSHVVSVEHPLNFNDHKQTTLTFQTPLDTNNRTALNLMLKSTSVNATWQTKQEMPSKQPFVTHYCHMASK